MKTQHIVLGATAVLGLAYFALKAKVSDWQEVLGKLKAFPTNIKRLGIEGGKFVCTFDLTIVNPTTKDFSPRGIVATLKRVNFSFLNGIPIASVIVNKESLNLPSGAKTTLKDLKLEIPLLQMVANISSLSKIKSISDLKISSVIDVLGKEIIIEA